MNANSNKTYLFASESVSEGHPDATSQVSVREIDGQPVVVEKVVPSTQHAPDVSTDALREIVRREIVDIAEHVGRSAMNRRNFTKVSAALASLFALPSWAVASTPDLLGKAERIPGKITRVRIGLHPTSELRARNHLDRLAGKVPTFLDPPDDDNNYWAEAIEDGDKFYYRARGAAVEIEEYEFHRVVGNPSLYYFSTALKLHCRIDRAKAGRLISS